MLDYTRVLREEHRQHLVADPDPLERALVVRGVLDEAELPLGSVGEDVRPPAIDQRANDVVGPSRFDAGQPSDPRASKNSRKHRFRLVVLRVTQGDLSRGLSRGNLMELLVATLAGARLN